VYNLNYTSTNFKINYILGVQEKKEKKIKEKTKERKREREFNTSALGCTASLTND
jgi:hypothetical protein